MFIFYSIINSFKYLTILMKNTIQSFKTRSIVSYCLIQIVLFINYSLRKIWLNKCTKWKRSVKLLIKKWIKIILN